MRSWSEDDAKSNFDGFLETCVGAGPQLVTRSGGGTTVLVHAVELQRLRGTTQIGLKHLLLAEGARWTSVSTTINATRRHTPTAGR